MLIGGDELLSEQITESACTLDRPGPLRPLCRPCQEVLQLCRARANTQFAQHRLRLVEGRCGVRALVRVDTDNHCHLSSPSRRWN